MAGPHLIFLLAEQVRFDALGAYGGRQCPTPKLDLLAQRATIFDRHYTNCPLSIPARAGLLTGLYPWQHGAIINGWLESERRYGTIKPGLDLLPRRLLDAGYRVVHAGVQHVRAEPPLAAQLRGVEFIGPPGAAEYHRELAARGLMLGDRAAGRDPIIDHENGRPVVFTSSAPRPMVFPLREDLFYDEKITQEMVDVIDAHDPARPLALFGMFWLVHPPLWAPRAFATMIEPENVELPGTVGRWFPGMATAQLANIPGQLGAHVSEEQWRQAWAVYLGMVALLDRCVGRVLAALDHAGALEGAMVVFTSGHGDMLGSHRLYGKMCMYEEAVRVPLLVKMPGQAHARRVTELTSHVDVMPTVLDVAGISPVPNAPDTLDTPGTPGRSLRMLAEGRPAGPPRAAVFASYDGNAGRGFAQRMVRTPTHKLIHNIGDHAEIYDLIEDAHETHNLLGREAARPAELELRAALNRWMDEMGDEAPRC